MYSRREFCAKASSFISVTAAARLGFASTTPSTQPEVARIDRHRILTAADRYLQEQPITITAYSASRSAGGKHDYFSEGDYWWPDPKDPNGPYIQRDGLSNPGNFNEHRHALIRLSVQVPALAAAWKLSSHRRYAMHAAKHLRAWFLHSATLMNPNLEYAQAIHGRATGRSIGIIDTLHLVEVVRAASVVEPSGQLSAGEIAGLKEWFAKYLSWMLTSPHGQEERDAKNNHGTCWVAQVAEFARFVGNRDATSFCGSHFREVLVPNQIAKDGSFPLELRRTKPYGYSLFNLEVMSAVCQILSIPGENLFEFRLPDGRGFAKAMEYMFPYIAKKESWPHPHDVEYWNDWPVRQVSLLFAGISLKKAEYIDLWRKLNPDPSVQEIIRNYPIRQPLLWVA